MNDAKMAWAPDFSTLSREHLRQFPSAPWCGNPTNWDAENIESGNSPTCSYSKSPGRSGRRAHEQKAWLLGDKGTGLTEEECLLGVCRITGIVTRELEGRSPVSPLFRLNSGLMRRKRGGVWGASGGRHPTSRSRSPAIRSTPGPAIRPGPDWPGAACLPSRAVRQSGTRAFEDTSWRSGGGRSWPFPPSPFCGRSRTDSAW